MTPTWEMNSASGYLFCTETDHYGDFIMFHFVPTPAHWRVDADRQDFIQLFPNPDTVHQTIEQLPRNWTCG